MTVYVYTLWTDGRRPLYVGMTGDIATRVKAHYWTFQDHAITAVDVTRHPDRTAARNVERTRIQALCPAKNDIHNPRSTRKGRWR